MSVRILGLSGSLRQASTNTALLRTAARLMPEGSSLTLHDYRDLPHYDGDLPKPPSVERLEAAIADADGLLLAVPEYNHSIPGPLKNAIDWASRPAWRSVFRDKPVGVVSAAASFVGGARGQQHAKLILLGMGSLLFPWPELLVGAAADKVRDGELVDPQSLGFLQAFVDGFVPWVARHR